MGDTIAAIATPQGEGGIGIVRISGDDSLNIMKKNSPSLPGGGEASLCLLREYRESGKRECHR